MSKTDWQNTDGEKDRSYDINGVNYPSVTTILSPMSDFLFAHVRWIEEGVNELYYHWTEGNAVPAWRVNGEAWELQPCKPEDLVMDGKYVSRIGFRKMKAFQEKGDLRHLLLENYSHGVQITNDLEDWANERIRDQGMGINASDALPSLNALWNHLQKWRPEILATEARGYSKLGYAGTLDAIAKYENHPSFRFGLIDCKPDTERKHVAQLAAYTNFDYIVTPEGQEVAMAPFEEAAILQVSELTHGWKAGLRKIGKSELDYWFGVFKHYLLAYQMVKQGKLPELKTKWD